MVTCKESKHCNWRFGTNYILISSLVQASIQKVTQLQSFCLFRTSWILKRAQRLQEWLAIRWRTSTIAGRDQFRRGTYDKNAAPTTKEMQNKNTNGTKQKNMAEMKQKTMMCFLSKMKVNKESVANIEASRKAVKELYIEMECYSAIDQIISCLELEEPSSFN